jgi:hypothetical protein
MKDNGGTAFPMTFYDRDSTGEYQPREQCEGMTLRDYFASKAMQGLIKEIQILDRYFNEAEIDGREKITAAVAEIAYDYADAMIAERNK